MKYDLIIYKYAENSVESEYLGSEYRVGMIEDLSEQQKESLCAIITRLGQTYHIVEKPDEEKDFPDTCYEDDCFCQHGMNWKCCDICNPNYES